MRTPIAFRRVAALFALFALAGCGTSNAIPPISRSTPASSVLNRLKTIVTVGSTVDPRNGDQNPYGLAIAPATAGLVTAGDLIVCNFNDGPTNTQGAGTTVIGLHSTPGSAPYRIAQDPSLRGCDALSIAADGTIWTADDAANDNAIVAPSGTILATLSAGTYPWAGPWGEAVASSQGNAVTVYVSNQIDGSIVRLTGTNSSAVTSMRIAVGFGTNDGVPGAILAPSGLTYDSASDTLYVVDGNVNRVVALANVSKIGADGVRGSGSGFGGPNGANARVVASGAPLNGPISAALLPTGNLVVGNTLDPAGTNLLVEISPTAGIIATKNVDTGAEGALFGIAAGGTAASPKIYFNDDNDNTVKLLAP